MVVDGNVMPKVIKDGAELGGLWLARAWADAWDGLQDDVQETEEDAENNEAEYHTHKVKLALRIDDVVGALRADVDVLVFRAQATDAKLLATSVLLSAVVVTKGHSAAAVSFL